MKQSEFGCELEFSCFHKLKFDVVYMELYWCKVSVFVCVELWQTFEWYPDPVRNIQILINFHPGHIGIKSIVIELRQL